MVDGRSGRPVVVLPPAPAEASGMDSTTSVRVRGLRKSYGETIAVDGVDLDIFHGEVFALLGPNGAGKTTTVGILEGYRRRDSGEVSVLGTDPSEGGREWRARIGIVLQSNADASELSVREMIRYFAAYYPDPRDPTRLSRPSGWPRRRAPSCGSSWRATRRPGSWCSPRMRRTRTSSAP